MQVCVMVSERGKSASGVLVGEGEKSVNGGDGWGGWQSVRGWI